MFLVAAITSLLALIACAACVYLISENRELRSALRNNDTAYRGALENLRVTHEKLAAAQRALMSDMIDNGEVEITE